MWGEARQDTLRGGQGDGGRKWRTWRTRWMEENRRSDREKEKRRTVVVRWSREEDERWK